MSWLNEIIDQHSELESPVNFWRWAALASISAIVKDRVWLDRQIYKLYPNIYVMFHADSGLKKGPPVSMAKQLVKAVGNTRIISGRSSIQGILKELGTARSIPGGGVVSSASAFIASSELSSSIVDDPIATTILTDLYDRQYNVGEWQSLLKMETFQLKDPCITMLTATNESHASSFFDKKDVSGGYFARTFIIYETKRNKANSLSYPLSNPPDYGASGEYLKTLSKLNGAFQSLAVLDKDDIFKYAKEIGERTIYFSESGLIYEDWYKEFIETLDASATKDETGTLNRFGDSVIKVAMLLSLAESPNLIISAEAMRGAIEICEKLVGNARKTTTGKGKDDTGNGTRKLIIIEELLKRDNHMMTRIQLNKKYWMQGNVNEWDECVVSLDAAGMIKITSTGNNVIYTMPDNIYQEMKRFYEGKQK